MHVSLDGFVAGPNGELEWAFVDEAMYDDVAAGLATVDTAIYGRVTYEMMESYWPTVPGDPASADPAGRHAHWYANAHKVIFSRTLDGVSRPNRQVMREADRAAVARLKQQPGGDMMIFGSPSIVHALAREGVVDEYRIHINPIILGSGTPLFEETGRQIGLELLDTKIFANGVVRLHYRTQAAI
jgi:dihydrofolate reductase